MYASVVPDVPPWRMRPQHPDDPGTYTVLVSLPSSCVPLGVPYLQVEHHLFPAISFVHYPAIARIVAEECSRAGIHYVHHPTLGGILAKFTACLRELGSAADDIAPAYIKAKAA